MVEMPPYGECFVKAIENKYIKMQAADLINQLLTPIQGNKPKSSIAVIQRTIHGEISYHI